MVLLDYRALSSAVKQTLSLLMSRYVVKLQKSLYGLKQARRRWYEILCKSLASVGFRRAMADLAVFFACVGNNIVILFIHVNDTTLTGIPHV